MANSIEMEKDVKMKLSDLSIDVFSNHVCGFLDVFELTKNVVLVGRTFEWASWNSLKGRLIQDEQTMRDLFHHKPSDLLLRRLLKRNTLDTISFFKSCEAELFSEEDKKHKILKKYRMTLKWMCSYKKFSSETLIEKIVLKLIPTELFDDMVPFIITNPSFIPHHETTYGRYNQNLLEYACPNVRSETNSVAFIRCLVENHHFDPSTNNFSCVTQCLVNDVLNYLKYFLQLDTIKNLEKYEFMVMQSVFGQFSRLTKSMRYLMKESPSKIPDKFFSVDAVAGTCLGTDARAMVCIHFGVCSYRVTGDQYYMRQWPGWGILYNCLTCFPEDTSVVICKACKDHCHEFHEVRPVEKRRESGYCDCGKGEDYFKERMSCECNEMKVLEKDLKIFDLKCSSSWSCGECRYSKNTMEYGPYGDRDISHHLYKR